MDNETVRVGVDIGRDKIRFIEAEFWNGKLTVTNVQQYSFPVAFDFTTIGDSKFIPRFAEIIDKACETFSQKAKSAFVSIDRRLTIKKTFAVDKKLTDEEIRQHIEWELEQVLIAPRDEYNVGYEHSIIPMGKGDVVVFVAVRKALIGYLKEIFKKSRLTLETVDLDLFASLRALQFAYKETLNGLTVLLEFTRGGVGFSILSDGRYALSSEMPPVVDGKDFYSLSSAEMADILQKEIDKLLINLRDNLGLMNLNRIAVAGEAADKALLNDLEHIYPGSASFWVDPFATCYKMLNLESQRLIENYPQSFLACMGMVL
ncbi:MAG: pilus assembly protein PilM [candidate division KSB1 bacterium]|nr:pilus assembly protein PilM [candidate division KSB1 bacterium]